MAAQLKHGIPANSGVLALTTGQARPRPRAPPDVACSSSSLDFHKIQSTLQNNASTQVAPIIEEEDETGGHENENEDGLQETQPRSIVTVQKVGGQGFSGRLIIKRGHSRGDDMLGC
ncbi:uncharacterized protein [Miscanthus floridulus]|uniref:uncharacterized protein isoform X4 n=1 Tax=Miscanthus floridulus TaxID=154761 RepID=UPI003458B9A6